MSSTKRSTVLLQCQNDKTSPKPIRVEALRLLPELHHAYVAAVTEADANSKSASEPLVIAAAGLSSHHLEPMIEFLELIYRCHQRQVRANQLANVNVFESDVESWLDTNRRVLPMLLHAMKTFESKLVLPLKTRMRRLVCGASVEEVRQNLDIEALPLSKSVQGSVSAEAESPVEEGDFIHVHPDGEEVEGYCTHCRQQLGFFRGRHHCRICRKAFCGRCCNATCELPSDLVDDANQQFERSVLQRALEHLQKNTIGVGDIVAARCCKSCAESYKRNGFADFQRLGEVIELCEFELPELWVLADVSAPWELAARAAITEICAIRIHVPFRPFSDRHKQLLKRHHRHLIQDANWAYLIIKAAGSEADSVDGNSYCHEVIDLYNTTRLRADEAVDADVQDFSDLDADADSSLSATTASNMSQIYATDWRDSLKNRLFEHGRSRLSYRDGVALLCGLDAVTNKQARKFATHLCARTPVDEMDKFAPQVLDAVVQDYDTLGNPQTRPMWHIVHDAAEEKQDFCVDLMWQIHIRELHASEDRHVYSQLKLELAQLPAARVFAEQLKMVHALQIAHKKANRVPSGDKALAFLRALEKEKAGLFSRGDISFPLDASLRLQDIDTHPGSCKIYADSANGPIALNFMVKPEARPQSGSEARRSQSASTDRHVEQQVETSQPASVDSTPIAVTSDEPASMTSQPIVSGADVTEHIQQGVESESERETEDENDDVFATAFPMESSQTVDEDPDQNQHQHQETASSAASSDARVHPPPPSSEPPTQNSSAPVEQSGAPKNRASDKNLTEPSSAKSTCVGDSSPEMDGPRVYRAAFKPSDVRPDDMIIRLIKLCVQLLAEEDMKLEVLTYRVRPTAPNEGIIQWIVNATTIQNIRGRNGLNPVTHAVYDKKNESGKHYNNFVDGLAFYTVTTLLFGIGDRHLENFMLSDQAHLFHIDYGFVLGKDPKGFLALKTALDGFLIDAIGSEKHQTEFWKKTARIYNILRKHAHLIIGMLSSFLKASPPIDPPCPTDTEGLANDWVSRFALGLTDDEAAAKLQGLVKFELTTRKAEFVHLFHGVGQTSASASQALSQGISMLNPMRLFWGNNDEDSSSKTSTGSPST